MRLIVGLGNPGEKYHSTRHNVGFSVVDSIARVNGVSLHDKKEFNAQVATASYDGDTTILAKPLSYMNESGNVVSKLMKYYKISSHDLIIIHDDLDIASGEYKISYAKNAAGHNGVQSIIDSLNTNAFWRVRIGLATDALQNAKTDVTDEVRDQKVGNFVLSKFSKDELEAIEKITNSALEELNKQLSVSRPDAQPSEEGQEVS